MDLRVLHYLVKIVQWGGFGKAAEHIHISQPALSKAIGALEEELGVTLLERGHRGGKIGLTAAGEIVHRHALAMLNNRQQLLNELQQLQGLQTGHLNIGLSPLGSADIFAPIIARFRATYPHITINLMERGGAEQEAALRRGEIELATSLMPTEGDSDIDWMPICDDPMMVALPLTHPLAHADTLHLSDLAQTPLVIFEHTFMLNRVILNACRNSGFEPSALTEVTHPDFGLALVAAGTGAMLLPRLITQRHPNSGVAIKPLHSESLRWQLSLIWRKNVKLSFAAEAMKQMMQSSLNF